MESFVLECKDDSNIRVVAFLAYRVCENDFRISVVNTSSPVCIPFGYRRAGSLVVNGYGNIRCCARCQWSAPDVIVGSHYIHELFER